LALQGSLKCLFLHPRLRKGSVAQLVEQRTENPCVGGSKPSRTTSNEKALQFAGPFLFGKIKFWASSPLKQPPDAGCELQNQASQ
jgi:hypothetical protein